MKQNHYFILGIALIAMATLLAYSSAMKGTFLWDDGLLLLKNDQAQDPHWLKKVWFAPGAADQYYPMVYSAFWLQYQLWGYQVLGYHLVNIALHIANAILVWVILRRLKIAAAFWVAAIFALHPVHVESVAWISELKNVLSGFFYLWAMLIFLIFYDNLSAQREVSWRNLLLGGVSLACYGLAVLSKTVTLSLPIALLIILYFRNRRITLRDVGLTAPLLLLGVSLALLTVQLERVYIQKSWLQDISLTFLDRSLIAGKALWFYPAKLILPLDLSFVYPLWRIDPGAVSSYLYPLSAVMLMFASFRFRHRWGPGILAGLLFYGVTIFPAIGFFDIETMQYSYVADHYQYLASLGILILLAEGSRRVLTRLAVDRRVRLTLAAGVIFVLGILSFQQAKIYRNIGILFTDILKKNPDCWMVYHNRGTLLAQKEKFALALADWEKAITLRPKHFLTYQNRALVYYQLGQFPQALGDIDQAIRLNPNLAPLYHQRALILQALGQEDLAVQANATGERLKAALKQK